MQRKAALVAWITGRFFLRFHMTVILGVTFLAGLAVTKMFLDAGNTNLALRYGVAMLPGGPRSCSSGLRG